MKKLLALLAVLLMLTGCSSAPAQKTDEELMAEGWVKNPLENGYILQAELPDTIDVTKKYKDADGNEVDCAAGVYAAACSAIDSTNFLDYAHRDDILYIDVRDFGDYAKKHLKNFEVIPYFALVFDAEAGTEGKPQLFSGTVKEPVATYKESVELLEVFFPKDKTIFLMCQSGGRVTQLMNLLEVNGWDMNKIYNIGGMGQYTGDEYKDYTTDSAEISIEAIYSFEGLTK